MSYDNRTVAVTLGNVKEAYLYFNHAVPVYVPKGFPGQIAPPRLKERFEGQVDMIEGRLNPDIHSRLGKKRIKILEKRFNDFCNEENSHETLPLLAFAISEMCKDLRKENYIVIPIFDRTLISLDDQSGFEGLSIVSSKVVDIDVDKAPWEQIQLFKQDRRARFAAKRYRLHWLNNYRGKDLSYIEDSLSIAYEDFREMAQKHGFSLISRTLESVINGKSALAASACALGAAVAGDYNIFKAALASGLVLELAGMTLSFRQATSDKKDFFRGHELLFLDMIKKNFPKTKF